jgi:hypothetical protein
MMARLLILAGTAVRLAYGAGALLSPSRMVAARLAPGTDGRPDPRMTLRGFGGHQLVVAAFTLATVGSPRLVRSALVLNMLIDALDVTAAALELRVRGRADRTLIGGIALSGTGIVAFALALRALNR